MIPFVKILWFEQTDISDPASLCAPITQPHTDAKRLSPKIWANEGVDL